MAREENELEQRRQQQGLRSNPRGESGIERWDPFASSHSSGGAFGFMRRMMDEMDRMFADLGFAEAPSEYRGAERSDESGSWRPRVDVRRRNDMLVIRADLPGVRQEDVDVEIEAGAVRIQGQRREEREEGTGETHRRECVYGSFVRTIPLPEGADAEHAKASFSNGVLEVTIPAPERRGRRIEISSTPEAPDRTTTH